MAFGKTIVLKMKGFFHFCYINRDISNTLSVSEYDLHHQLYYKLQKAIYRIVNYILSGLRVFLPSFELRDVYTSAQNSISGSLQFKVPYLRLISTSRTIILPNTIILPQVHNLT
jgi:hypothetical protein